jgi:hypothetical protein
MARALEIAELVKRAYVDDGVDPSAAICKFADELTSEPFVELVVAKSNHAIWKNAFETQSDKNIEFPIAKAETVRSLINATDSLSHKVASIWRKDLAFTQAGPEKLATDKRGRQLTSYGIPVVGAADYSMKAAAEHEMGAALMRADAAHDMLKQAEFTRRTELFETIADFKDRIKQAAAETGEVFPFCWNTVHACEPEKRAMASEMAGNCVDALLAEGGITPAQYGAYASTAKTASIDMDDQSHAVLRGGDSLVLRLNTCLGNATGHPGRPEKGPRRENGSMTDADVPYELEGVFRPRQSRPQIQRGGILETLGTTYRNPDLEGGS